MYANLCAKSNAAQILFRRRESHAVTKSARPGDLQSVQFFYCATSIEMGDDIAKMLHIHLGFFQLLGYAWDPALIIALTSKYLLKLFSRKKLALLYTTSLIHLFELNFTSDSFSLNNAAIPNS